MKIAVLGTGAMGARMAHRLIASGEHEVTVWNRTATRTRPLLDAGASGADTPAHAAAGADLVLSMLRDDDAARSTWLDPAVGALPAMAPGAVAVDCSTVTPAWSRRLAAECAERSVAFLDAPVAGSRPQADAGALIFFVGGDAGPLDRVGPVLGLLGAAVHHIGPAGSGAQVKLAVNALFAVQVGALAELLAGLRGSGVDPARAAEVIGATPVAGPAAAAAGSAMVRRDFTPAFPIELVEKDLGYATDDAATRDVELPVVTATLQLYRRAAHQGYAQDNITGVIQLHQP